MTAATLDHIGTTLKLLTVACNVAGITVSGDQRVGERDAAILLGYHPKYLQTLRQEGKAPTSYKRGLGGCRVSYRLIDLAEWIEFARASV